MQRLTKQEWKFLKDNNLTPTVIQCDEWKRSTFRNLKDAVKTAEKLGINFEDLTNKMFGDMDFITLENEAVYVLYNWFTEEELENLTDEEVTKFLQDWKYFGGYRKWDGGNLCYVEEALQVYHGQKFFEIDPQDSQIWVVSLSDMNTLYTLDGEKCWVYRNNN